MRKWTIKGLTYGTRFQFIGDQDQQQWVRIGRHSIAEWDGEHKLNTGYYQIIKQLSEKEIYNTEVIVL